MLHHVAEVGSLMQALQKAARVAPGAGVLRQSGQMDCKGLVKTGDLAGGYLFPQA